MLSSLGEIIENSQMLLTLLWASIQLCLVCFTISAWVASGRVQSACNPVGGGAFSNSHEAFVLVWQTFLAIGISVAGTLVLKKHRNQLSIGALIGASIIMSNWMLCIAVQEGGQANLKHLLARTCRSGLETFDTSADSAVTFFAVLLFLLYAAFGFVLARSRKDILGDDEPLMGLGSDPAGYVNAMPGDAMI